MTGLDLAGKRIIVTGGASGIGLATALCLQDNGASVVLADLDATELERVAIQHRVAGWRTMDVTDESACDGLVSDAVEILGGLDGLFHSAGIADAIGPAIDTDVDKWQRVIDVHLRGSFLMSRAAGRELVKQGSGSILMVSSIAGVGALPRRNAYSPAKAAVGMLAQTLASEWGSSGVRVNCIAPGYIATPMLKNAVAAGLMDIRRLEGRTPLGRLGTPLEIAQVSAFLLSGWASYVTGAIVPVDGGWTAFGGSGDVGSA